MPRSSITGSGSCGDPVEEAEHAAQPAVAVDDGDVESDHRGVGAPRAELPAEPSLLMVGVDGTGEAEHEVGELGLDRAMVASMASWPRASAIGST